MSVAMWLLLKTVPVNFLLQQHSPEMACFSFSHHNSTVPSSLVFFFNQYPFESISLLFKMHFFKKATGEDKHFKVGFGIICISPFFGEQSF